MIRMQANMLYERYIIFRYKNNEVLAIDTKWFSDNCVAALYIWEQRDRYPEQDTNTKGQVRVIGVDIV